MKIKIKRKRKMKIKRKTKAKRKIKKRDGNQPSLFVSFALFVVEKEAF
ncbi:MAG: hypothetical protein ACYS47_05870 [Planctomycetota bacterium]|jgi:ribosomal protein L18